ncbi:MAG: Do family serine endopeptidase [Bacteroidetes bacterium]|nr:Do family serine endopeptidase [Bacteroidota bacterium]
MNRKNIFGVISLLIVGTVFGAVLVSGFGYVRPALADVRIGSDQPPVPTVNADAQAFNDAFVNVSEKVTPSIVQIRVISSTPTKTNDAFKFFFPFQDKESKPQDRESGGSGVIISQDGYILTNNHVVENATKVEVALHDKRQLVAEVIGTDPLTDLAVIKINTTNLPAAYLGNSDEIKVGQWVMAIGNPLSLSSTVTAGIVSATGRDISILRDKDGYGVESFIQTDAAINPGNSGGALVALNGAVIGINSAIATNGFSGSYIGYGFAIPINLAKSVAEDLIANGKVSRGYIGVRIEEVDSDLAKAVGLDKAKGVVVQDVVKDGAAASEDIKSGDVILKIDEREINQANELQAYVATKRAGDLVKLTIFRDGKEIKRSVKLKGREADNETTVLADNRKDSKKKDNDIVEKEFDSIGLTVKNLSKAEYDSYKVENGVIITSVKRFSKAEDQRLGRGVVITEADKKSIDSVKDFEKSIEAKKGKAILLKLVYSDGSTRLVGLDIPKE